MSSRRWIVPSVMAWATAVAVILGGLRADAGMQSAAAPATSTAVVDIQRLINGLTEFKEAQTKLEAAAKEKQAELKALEDNLKSLKGEYDLEKDKASAASREKAIKIAEQGQALESKRKLLGQEMEIRAGEAMFDIYQRALGAVDKMAKEGGWELVLVDDRSIVWPQGRVKTNDRINEFITAKRVLFAAERIDLTPQLITRMNNAFAAGGGKP